MITVLQSVRTPSESTNPYFPLLTGSLPSHIKVIDFTWRSALTARYQIFHLHWPEHLIRGNGKLRNAIKHILSLLLLGRLAISRTPVVRTLHNITPHDGEARLEGLLRRIFDHLTKRWIVLNEASLVQQQEATTSLILHGHYRDWFALTDEINEPPDRSKRILYFGIIKRYKNVDTLIERFRELTDSDVRLRVAGFPVSTQLRSIIQRLASSDARVEVDLNYIDDQTLASYIKASGVVALPYSELNNSGAALLALSLDRPIVVPRGAVSIALRAEVGQEWVHIYDPPLHADDLRDALSSAASRASRRPNLDQRGWDKIGQQHAQVFERTLPTSTGPS